MRRMLVLTIAIVVSMPVTGAHAAAPPVYGELVCAFQSHVVIDPPAGLSGRHDVHFASDSGSILGCGGFYLGHPDPTANPKVATRGTVGYQGTAGNEGISTQAGGDQCAIGSGAGTFRYDIDFTDGTALGFTGAFTYSRLAAGGFAQGSYAVDAGSGTFTVVFQFVPDMGQDCTTGVSGATVIGQLVLVTT